MSIRHTVGGAQKVATSQRPICSSKAFALNRE